jgi:hypothetical protein
VIGTPTQFYENWSTMTSAGTKRQCNRIMWTLRLTSCVAIAWHVTSFISIGGRLSLVGELIATVFVTSQSLSQEDVEPEDLQHSPAFSTPDRTYPEA